MSDFATDTAAMRALVRYLESQLDLVQRFDVVRDYANVVSARYALVSHSSANVYVQLDLTQYERDDAQHVSVSASLRYYTAEHCMNDYNERVDYLQSHDDTVNIFTAVFEHAAVLAAVQSALADARDNCAVDNAVARH